MTQQKQPVSRRQQLAMRVISPFQAFAQGGSLGGLLLLLGALIAFGWANSPWAPAYERMISEYLSINVGDWSLRLSLGHWVNDALMAIFFLLVGLELKAGHRRAVSPSASCSSSRSSTRWHARTSTDLRVLQPG